MFVLFLNIFEIVRWNVQNEIFDGKFLFRTVNNWFTVLLSCEIQTIVHPTDEKLDIEILLLWHHTLRVWNNMKIV